MEARIEQCHLKGVDDNEAVAKATMAKAAKSKKGKTPRKAPAGELRITKGSLPVMTGFPRPLLLNLLVYQVSMQ